MYGSSNFPVSFNFFTIGFIILIGIANPIPSLSSIFNVVIPNTCPLSFISAPPLFPSFIVASVCNNPSKYVFLFSSSIFIVLFTPLIIPDVTVL